MMALLSLLGARTVGVWALFMTLAFAWQSARIEGVPLLGGGLNAQVAQLQARLAADELARAKETASVLTARARIAAAADEQARGHAVASRANLEHIRKVIERIPVHGGDAREVVCGLSSCVLSWGAVRLLDAAASGADIDDVAARVGAGQPDDAASGVALSEAVALLAGNLAIARDNADQLRHLEGAIH